MNNLFFFENHLLTTATKQLRELEIVHSQLEEQLKKSPEGKLRISTSRGYSQFYHVVEKKNRFGKFLSKNKKSEEITKLAEKEYYKKALKNIEGKINVLQSFMETYPTKTIETIYEEMHTAIKPFLSNIHITKQEYSENWQKRNYKRKAFNSDDPEHITSFGLRVRSKSEVLIAETLYRHKIPFRYEFPVKTNEGYSLHPDFYCLNQNTRQEIIWEHFGLMDNSEYACNVARKIDVFRENGWHYGKNFCFTMETMNHPLTLKQIESVIKDFFG